MGKFVGWKCDVCNTAENGNDAPEDWLRLRLPSNGSDNNTRDLCSDKCLVKFAKDRAGIVSRSGGSKGKSDPVLVEWLRERGIKGSALGGTLGMHVRRRHEVAGAVDDCLVCQWMTTKSDEV